MKTLQLTIYFCLITISTFSQFMEPYVINENGQTYTASFIAEWGADTASIETFTLVGNHLFGRAIHLYPEPHLRQFSYNYNEDGSIRNMDVQFYDLSNTSKPLESKTGLPVRITMTSQNEVVDFRLIDKSGEKQFVHNSKRMDFFGGWTPIFGQWEWLNQLVIAGEINDGLKFLNYVIGDYDMEIIQLTDKIIEFSSDISAPIKFYLDSDNHIERIDALGSPWNYTITRHAAIDIENHTNSFAKKKIIGDPSPHEQFNVNVGECNIRIDYGRPSKRGRTIFGNVVPWGEVWRTGAGTPTTITSTCDLVFQDKLIPKGTYNVFTIPSENKWALIFNTEEEAWGSAYKKEYDFERVIMASKKVNSIQEKFLIEIISQENNKGKLIMAWDDITARIEFRTKK